MSKLSDIQLLLLSTAAQRADGSLFPPPQSLATQANRLGRTIASLMKEGLVQEAEVTDHQLSWREEGDKHFGMFITDAGRQAIGVEPLPLPEAAEALVAQPEKATSKAQLVVELLKRNDGATLDDLVAATGWLPHTTRAALTGLRKKGHVIAKSKRVDVTCYKIEQAA